ncbi:uncharacterized protein SCHCODRAFT_02663836 [Schizophyllum commune H4-8]|nr:uncharacterized protein SCHCODRAFT_02663836 [Schizophyllum commune H4-8]KAI5895959.1 hypothetical protein SCHCODRAFT_02663836 [Schizophyllum commune H4-8]
MSRQSRASRQREVTVPPRLEPRSSIFRQRIAEDTGRHPGAPHPQDDDDVEMPSAEVFTTPPPDTAESTAGSSARPTTVDTSRRRRGGQKSKSNIIGDDPASTSTQPSSGRQGRPKVGNLGAARTRTRQQAMHVGHVATQSSEVLSSDATSPSDVGKERQIRAQKRGRSRIGEDDTSISRSLAEARSEQSRKRTRTSTSAEHEDEVGRLHEDMFAQISQNSSLDLICNLGAARARELCAYSAADEERDFAVSSVQVHFSKGKLVKPPKPSSLAPLLWDDATPRRFLDKTGTALVVHLPGLLTVEAHARATTTLMELAKSHPELVELGHANNRKEYRSEQGRVSGKLALFKASKPGDPSDRLPVASASIASGPTRYRDMHELLRTLRLVSDPVDAALQAVDAIQYTAFRELNDRLESKCAYMLALNSVDPIVFSNRAIDFNRRASGHINKDIHPNSWVSLTAVGDFKQGSMYIPGLNLRLRLEPRDAVLFRGHALKYEVGDWNHGQLITIVDSTDQFLWDSVSLNCP